MDALPPDALQTLVLDAVSDHLDEDAYDEVIAREQSDRDTLQAILETT